MWTLVIPHGWKNFKRKTKPISNPQKRHSIKSFDDFEESSLLMIGEALFPLFIVIATRAVRVYRGPVRTFYAASVFGALKLGKWLLEIPQFSLVVTKKEVIEKNRSFNANKSRLGCLAYCCGHGHLDFAKWMVEKFGLTTVKNALSNSHDIKCNQINFALCAAARHGNMECVSWLLTTFKAVLNVRHESDILERKLLLLEMACRSGNLDLVTFLFNYFNMKQFPFRVVLFRRMFAGASRSDNFELVKWVCSIFPKIPEEQNIWVSVFLKPHNWEILQFICNTYLDKCDEPCKFFIFSELFKHEHFDVAMESMKKCGMPSHNLKMSIFSTACLSGHFSVLNWISHYWKDILDIDTLVTLFS